MATQEARQLLDSLMGGDRNAPLPKGAAIPGKLSIDSQLLQKTKRQRSCYDRDIDPLYCAWGVNVYDLFVNTKSDIGTNPYVVDIGAHREYQKLPKQEHDKMGYEYFLFQKLNELVRQCDRTVARNKEKLKQEVNRKLRGGQEHFVQDVDEMAVEQLVRNIIAVEQMESDLQKYLDELKNVVEKEEDRKQKLEPLLEAQREKNAKNNMTSSGGATDDNAKKEEVEEEEEDKEATTAPDRADKDGGDEGGGDGDDTVPEIQSLQTELGQMTMEKQKIVFRIGQILDQCGPISHAVETQRRHLDYVKSDISTDKTVCEISGNFMSSRDADERIAAHYAGKQYVGWKLVRDKLQSMKQQCGKYGPPPPGRSGPPSSAPPPSTSSEPPRGSYGGGRGGGYGGGGGRDYPPRDHRGGGGGGRWERQGGGGYQDQQQRGGRRPSGGGGGGPPPRGGWRR